MGNGSADFLSDRVRENKAWSDFAASIDAQFSQGEGLTARVHSPSFRGWEIMLDSYMGKGQLSGRAFWYTRVRAPYKAMSSLRFEIRQTRWADTLVRYMTGALKSSRSPYVKLEYPELGKRFMIKSKSAADLQLLFASPRVRASLAEQPSLDLRVAEVLEEGVSTIVEWIDELYFQARGRISDPESLMSLSEFLVEVLNRLREMGVAQPRGKSVYRV